MFKKEIHTEIDIDADPLTVWDVLVDLAAYPDWNPMVKKASGEVRAGQRLKLHYEPEGQKRRTFKPLLLVVEPGQELRWQGQPGIRHLFESEHIYPLHKNPPRKNPPRPRHDLPRTPHPTSQTHPRKSTRKPFNDVTGR